MMEDRESAMSSAHASSVHGGAMQQPMMHQTAGGGAHFTSNAQPASNQPASVLNNFDFTAIDELDPSLGKSTKYSNTKASVAKLSLLFN